MTAFDNSRFNSASYLRLKSDQCSSPGSPGLDPPLPLSYNWPNNNTVYITISKAKNWQNNNKGDDPNKTIDSLTYHITSNIVNYNKYYDARRIE